MNILHVSNLSKQIGPATILADISFQMQEGEFVGLIGPNGAGKTTTIKCITGQLIVPEHTVRVCGHDIALDGVSAKSSFGYAVEPAILPPQLTGTQFIELIAAARRLAVRTEELSPLLELLSLKEKIQEHIGTYSQGMKQKLSIICALMGKPPLIILDESLNGLDPVSSYRLKLYLKEIAQKKESSVLLSSHGIDSVEKYCSRVILLHRGSIRKVWTQEELAAEKDRTKKDFEQIFIDTISTMDAAPRTI